MYPIVQSQNASSTASHFTPQIFQEIRQKLSQKGPFPPLTSARLSESLHSASTIKLQSSTQYQRQCITFIDLKKIITIYQIKL